jgi:hypothetical protein
VDPLVSIKLFLGSRTKSPELVHDRLMLLRRTEAQGTNHRRAAIGRPAIATLVVFLNEEQHPRHQRKTGSNKRVRK